MFGVELSQKTLFISETTLIWSDSLYILILREVYEIRYNLWVKNPQRIKKESKKIRN